MRSLPARAIALITLMAWPAAAFSQDTQPAQPAQVHEHVAVAAPALTPVREVPGTSWVPDVAPMYGVHQPWRGWDLRLDGIVFVQALFEPGDRHRTGGASSRQGDSVNWAMFMARRPVAGGRFGIRTMVSAEPWTVPDCGSLSFLATGEVCEEDTVHDRQDPHDLFTELAVDYERPLLASWRWQVYAGLAGIPALGPPAYLHRASSVINPLAPITHHWLDAPRATFGIVTAAVRNQRWKAEWSVFNGRDADESRVDLDLGALDSASARLSVSPTDRLALQVSAGRMRDVRSSFPFELDDSFTRFTASAIYYRPLTAGRLWATTLAYGATRGREIVSSGELNATTSGGLLESSITLSPRHTFFGRAEVGGMPAHHLHAHEYSTQVFIVSKVQLGYVRQFTAVRGLTPGIGATAGLSLVPPELAPRYSGRAPGSFGVFFSLQAARHQM